MHPRLIRSLLLAILLPPLVAPGAEAQSPTWTAGATPTIETYTFGDPGAVGLESVSLFSLPFAGGFRPVSWLRIDVSGAYAAGTVVRPDGSRYTLAGPVDTALRFAVPLGRDRVTLAATALLPTGQSTYAFEDAEVAGVIAADILPFRLSNWGSGGGVDVTSSVAVPLGAVNLGARVGVQVGREFDLLDGATFQYRPGNQLYGRVALDGDVGGGRAAAQLTAYRFGQDQVDDQNLYRAGKRAQLLVTYAFSVGRMASAATYLGALRRQRGAFLDGSTGTPAQTVFLAGGELRQPFRYGILEPSVDVRILRNDAELDQGFIGGAGVSAELRVPGRTVTVLPTARVRLGRIEAQGGAVSRVTGVELGAGIRFGGPWP